MLHELMRRYLCSFTSPNFNFAKLLDTEIYAQFPEMKPQGKYATGNKLYRGFSFNAGLVYIYDLKTNKILI